nr:hypothetical protein [Tanacetum cinerariifolium]
QLAVALGARDAARNLEPLMGIKGNGIGGNGNGRNVNRGNKNRGNGNGENGMVMGTDEEMAITSEDLCLLESRHVKTS